MTDVHTPEQRRRNMSAIRSRNTRPEMLIRCGLHRLGFRYSLHHRKLPGHPDIVLSRYKAVIFVHGCFWHGHQCALFRWPTTRAEFWRTKILHNRTVDSAALDALDHAGWRILTIWECALKGRHRWPLEELLQRTGDWIKSESLRKEVQGRDTDSLNPGDQGAPPTS